VGLGVEGGEVGEEDGGKDEVGGWVRDTWGLRVGEGKGEGRG